MEIAVVYQSRKGKTKKVAEAIAKSLHSGAWSIEEVKDLKCDLLFLGTGVYFAGVGQKMERFLASLSGISAKKAVIFGTSAGSKKPFLRMKKILEEKDIPVDKRMLLLPGKWLMMNKGRPSGEDLVTAKVWAQGIVSEI